MGGWDAEVGEAQVGPVDGGVAQGGRVLEDGVGVGWVGGDVVAGEEEDGGGGAVGGVVGGGDADDEGLEVGAAVVPAGGVGGPDLGG